MTAEGTTKLRRWRLEHKLTLGDVERRTGGLFPVSTLSYVETGDRNLSPRRPCSILVMRACNPFCRIQNTLVTSKARIDSAMLVSALSMSRTLADRSGRRLDR